jgi:hypothetical protein
MSLRTFQLPVFLVMLLPLAGCPVVAYIAAQVKPPKKIKAVYELPSESRLLVLVEDYAHQEAYELASRELSNRLSRELRQRGIVRETIPHERLMALRFETPRFHALKIPEIGQKLGADLVLYVQIEKFQLKDNYNDTMWHGLFEATVRVVKASGEGDPRLWPRDRPTGYPVGPVERDPALESSPLYADRLTVALAGEMADRIAKLFFDHRLSEMEGWKSDAKELGEETPQ